MSLPPGTRFGPYEIQSPIGAGGMGEVYRARDTTLHRFVAIKVLSDTFVRDPDRVARLHREARTLAALNDPHIGAIFGLQDAGDRHALVLELVEGPTLAERISHGALSVRESLAIAAQIAAALDAAHQLNVVHRDLKPANIKVREDGAVKVLDFGLAKALGGAAGDAAESSPTITSPATLTAAGLILGSAAYMAPEQATGAAVDKRCDIWAFGCVLYEMLTGARAFSGAGVTDTLAAVLRGDPNWAALPADLPPSVRSLLVRCLEKDRRQRVQDISTARFVLAEQAATTSGSAPPAGIAPARRRSGLAPWIAATAVLGVAAGAAAVAVLTPAATTVTRAARFELGASSSEPLSPAIDGSLVALAPDGESLVYTAMRDGGSILVVKRLDRLEATPIAGTEGAIDPFFSPDGEQIGFVVAGELRKIPVRGGQAVMVARGDPTFEGAAWGPDGTIVYANAFALYRIDAGGGQPVKIIGPDQAQNDIGCGRPELLPGGDVVLYTVSSRGGRQRIAARRLKGGDAVTVVDGGFGARYLAPGYLLYGQADHLMAVAFNPSTLRTSGVPIQIEASAFTKPAEAVSNVSTAANGRAVFILGHNPSLVGRLVRVERNGTHVSRVSEPIEDPRNLRISPDGTRLAVTVGPAGQGDIWIYDLKGSAPPFKVTFHDHNTFPIWTADGRHIIFMQVAAGIARVFTIASDGGGAQPEPLAANENAGAPEDLSPDGTALLLLRASTLWVRHLPGMQETRWIPGSFSQFGARFSPDGRWVAYGSTQNGAGDVWIRPYKDDGPPVRVSASGGHDPVWSRDGKELYYVAGAKLMAARVAAANGQLRLDPPVKLFEGGFTYNMNDPILRMFDADGDGRLVMIEPIGVGAASLVVTEHWADELKTRLTK